ncbi:MAG: DUF1559 domain-containing protein [Planctomycetaceae bacterium]
MRRTRTSPTLLQSHPLRVGPRKAFTIVELLVVMVVLATLLALALPAVTKVRATSRKTSCLNNVRNIAVALPMFDQTNNRLPPSGAVSHDASMRNRGHYSWAVAILPWVEQKNLFDQLDLDLPLFDPANDELRTAHVPVYVCPVDISRSDEGDQPDLSYVVNGGMGFTLQAPNGTRDCPSDPDHVLLDLNGDGSACSGTAAVDDLDRKLFDHVGLFFMETLNTNISKRHHQLADCKDGLSQTFLVSENARTGIDPSSNNSGFANPGPYVVAFYVGNPCNGGHCSTGNVDFSRCNAGNDKINSGLWEPEGTSPVPNSFHDGGVHMAFADAHVTFLAENIDGGAYAAMSSPVGILLEGTPLQQPLANLGGL